jgi:hypothetical protein
MTQTLYAHMNRRKKNKVQILTATFDLGLIFSSMQWGQ